MRKTAMSAALTTLRLVKQKFSSNSRSFLRVAFSDKFLLVTNVSVAVGLSGLGDVIEQRLEIFQGELSKFDPTRNFNMSMTGLPSGIICHNWYKFLDKRIPGSTIKIALKKMVIDQIFCSPLCISSVFLTLAILERKEFQSALEEAKKKAWKLYVAEWVVWPPAQFINFYILPLRFRVLFDSAISLGYDIYTSFVAYSKTEQVLSADGVPNVNKISLNEDSRENVNLKEISLEEISFKDTSNTSFDEDV